MKQWSPLQHDIFTFVEIGAGNAIIEAVAGSGKSTTIIECLSRIPKDKQSIFLAFNKTIADELKAKGVNARTFHSLTYMPVIKAKRATAVDQDKLRKIIQNELRGNESYIYGNFINKLVSLGRQTGIGCLIPDNQSEWFKVIYQYDLQLDHEEATYETAIELCSKVLRLSNSSSMVDFDDLLYLSVKDGLSLPKFDFVFVDEAQDTNAIQRAILRKIMKPTTRIVAVGDSSQAIYGFRGADSDSMSLIATEFNCVKLPLTVTYRCPTSVVEFAKRYVSEIESAPNAAEGKVTHLDKKWSHEHFVAKDLVVCRTTKPLIKLAFKLIREKVPCYMLGKEIGQGLKTLINSRKAKSIDMLEKKLELWQDREVEKAIAKQQEATAEAIRDKVASIFAIIEGMSDKDRTVDGLLNTIDLLFSDKTNATILSTIHKAKGLEANRVFWLNSSQCPSKWAKLDWQVKQEYNLCYVAITRAKQELFLIEE